MREPLFKKNQTHQLQERLREQILASRDLGDRLPSVRALADQFGTSTTTVKGALARLEREGLVERRPRSGTYVADALRPLALRDTVALAMPSGGHVWGELAGALVRQLQQRDRTTTLIETAQTPPAKESMVRRAVRSELGCMFVHGNFMFPFQALDHPAAQRLPVIGLIDWDSERTLPWLYRVLSDHAAGGKACADHLWTRGHRNVLVLSASATPTRLTSPDVTGRSPGEGFVSAWRALGGDFQVITSRPAETPDADVTLDEQALLGTLKKSDAPTAIFGTRDIEVLLAQHAIRRHAPDRLADIDLVGYYNTPWSRAAHPPITSVDLNLSELLDTALDLYDRLAAGEKVQPATTMIQPRLIVRDQIEREQVERDQVVRNQSQARAAAQSGPDPFDAPAT